MKTRVSLRYFVSYCSLVLVEHSVGFNTSNTWTLPMAIHSWHVAIKPLRWWGWVHWIVFMKSLYILCSLLCFVHVEYYVCHKPISVLIIIYIFNDYNIYIYIKQMKHPITIMICIWYTGINSTSHFLDGFLLQMFLIFVATGIKRSKNGPKSHITRYSQQHTPNKTSYNCELKAN